MLRYPWFVAVVFMVSWATAQAVAAETKPLTHQPLPSHEARVRWAEKTLGSMHAVKDKHDASLEDISPAAGKATPAPRHSKPEKQTEERVW